MAVVNRHTAVDFTIWRHT